MSYLFNKFHTEEGIDLDVVPGITVALVGTPADYNTDGTADDVQIQAAIDAVGSNGIVRLRSGSYTLASSLTIASSGVVIEGEGTSTVIRFPGDTVTTAFKMADTVQRTQIKIRNLRIASSVSGYGVGIDASYFAVCRFSDLLIDGVNGGMLFNAIGTYYNLVDNIRVNCSGSGSYGLKFDNIANENTVMRARISPGSDSIGVIVNAHSNELYSVDVETNALIGINCQSDGDGTLISSCYLEANQTNLQIDTGARGVVVLGGTIQSGKIANIVDHGTRSSFLSHAVNLGNPPFSVTADGSVVAPAFRQTTGSGLVNNTTFANSRFSANATGALIDRDVADDHAALTIRQVNSSSTGNILSIENNSVAVAYFKQNGDVQFIGTLIHSAAGKFISVTDVSGITEYASLDSAGKAIFSSLTLTNDGSTQTKGITFGADSYFWRSGATELSTNTGLSIGGALSTPIVTKTSNYTVNPTDSTVLVDATSGVVTVTLPPATGIAGRTYTVKKNDGSGNAVTVSPATLPASGEPLGMLLVLTGVGATQLIDGSGSYSLAAQNKSATFQSDGQNWYVIAAV